MSIPIPVDITNFTREDLMSLVLAFQQRTIIQAQYLEVLQAKMEGLSTENETLRKILAERIVGVLTNSQPPTTIESVIQQARLIEQEGSKEEPTPETTDENVPDVKDKDKFQA